MKTIVNQTAERDILMLDIYFPSAWGWPEIQEWNQGHRISQRCYLWKKTADQVRLEGLVYPSKP